jgi:hypothetical protein
VRVEAQGDDQSSAGSLVGLELESVLGKIKARPGDQFPSVNDPEKKPEKKSKRKPVNGLASPSGLGLVAADNVLPKPKRGYQR